jgi:hypothetical protein
MKLTKTNMLNLEIKLGTEINQIEEQIVKIKIPQTKFFVIGEKTEKSKWDLFIWDPDTQTKDILKKGMTTKNFSLLSSLVLKTPFPYEGKEITLEIIKSYIKKLKNPNGKHNNNSRNISN